MMRCSRCGSALAADLLLGGLLVHFSIAAGGRVTPSDKSQPEIMVTLDQLVRLADAIFTWKERLRIARQLQLMPVLDW